MSYKKFNPCNAKIEPAGQSLPVQVIMENIDQWNPIYDKWFRVIDASFNKFLWLKKYNINFSQKKKKKYFLYNVEWNNNIVVERSICKMLNSTPLLAPLNY